MNTCTPVSLITKNHENIRVSEKANMKMFLLRETIDRAFFCLMLID